MRRMWTEMWVLTKRGVPVKDKWGAYVMTRTKVGADALVYERGQEEVPKKCRVTIEDYLRSK